MIKPGSYRLLFDLLEHNNPDIIYFNEHTTCKKPQPEKGYPNNQPTCGSHLEYNTCISGEECFIRLCTRGSFEEQQTGMYITRKNLLDPDQRSTVCKKNLGKRPGRKQDQI